MSYQNKRFQETETRCSECRRTVNGSTPYSKNAYERARANLCIDHEDKIKEENQIDMEPFETHNSVALLIFSIFMILMQVEQIVVSEYGYFYAALHYDVAIGIWIGAYYLINSCLSLLSSK